jgi:hypothetical protein
VALTQHIVARLAASENPKSLDRGEVKGEFWYVRQLVANDDRSRHFPYFARTARTALANSLAVW